MSNDTQKQNTPADEKQQSLKRFSVRVNGRFLLVLVLLSLILFGGTYALHAFQMKRNAESLLDLAGETAQKGETSEAIEYLRQYLRFKPLDYDAKVQLVDLVEQSTRDVRARLYVLGILEDVLRNDPHRSDAPELRRRIVEYSLSLQRPRDALAHLKILMKNASSDPELIFLEGQCYEALGTYRTAIVKYLTAIQRSEQTVDYYVRLAGILSVHPDAMPYREDLEELLETKINDSLTSLFPVKRKPNSTNTDKSQEKTEVVDANEVVERIYARLVQQGRPRHQALVARADYYRSQRKFQPAQDDIDEALSLAGDESEVLLSASTLALTRAEQALLEYRSTEHRTHLDRAGKLAEQGSLLEAPDNLRFFEQLARIEQQRATFAANSDERMKHLSMAAESLQRGLDSLKDYGSTEQGKEASERVQLLLREITIRLLRAELLLRQARNAGGEIDREKLDEYVGELHRLKELGASPLHLGLLETQALLAQRKWREATEKLTPLRVRIEGFPLLRRRMDQALSECYRQLHNSTGRIQVLQQGLSVDALWHEGRLLLADALADRNRLDEAIGHYGFLLQHKIAEASLAAIRLQIRKLAALPPAQRDLSAVYANLDSAERENLDDVAITILRADALFIDSRDSGQTRFDKLEKLLEAAIGKHSENDKLRAVRAKFEALRSDQEATTRIQHALQLLDQAEEKLGKRSVLMITRAEIAARLSADAARPVLTQLESQAKELPRDQHIAVWEAVARSYATLGQLEEGRATWQQLTELSLDNLTARLASALLAVRLEDQQGLQTDLKIIREIEGTDGPWGNFYEALGLIVSAFEKIKSERAQLTKQLNQNNRTSENSTLEAYQRELAQARLLLTHAARLQPQWPEFPHQLGRVEALLDNRDEAYRHYRRAIELGDRTSTAFTSAVAYLVDERRFDEADELIRLAGDAAGTLLSPDNLNFTDQHITLSELAVQVAYSRGEISRARSFFPEDSKDYRHNLFRALLYLAEYQAVAEDQKSGSRGENFLKLAEEQFGKAVRNAPDAPQPWIFWVYHLGRLKRVTDGEKTIAEAYRSLPENLKEITAARCYAILGNSNKAEQHFLTAVRSSPDDPALRLVAARFYVSLNQFDKAGAHLEKVLDPKTKATDGQRTVARHLQVFSIANRGGYSDLIKALEMLEKPASATLAELYTRVAILQKSPLKRDRLELIGVLEQINLHRRLTPENRFVLAQLYEEAGRWNDTRQIMDKLLESDSKNTRLLYWYAVAGIRNRVKASGQLTRTRELLARLQAVEPDALRTAAVEARLLHAQNRTADAAKILEQAANRIVQNSENPTADELNRFRSVSLLCEELDLNTTAERILRRYAQLAGRPEDVLTVATFLGRHSRYSEALEICRSSLKSAQPIAVAVTIVNVVSLGKPSDADIMLAQKLFQDAMNADSNSDRIQIAYAGLLTVVDRLDDAETVYRKYLSRNPDNVAVLNNLAWLLAMRNKSLDEALQFIDHAIYAAGPRDEFLDTRAVVLLQMQQPQEAISNLQQALVEEPAAAYYLHLAQAHLAAGEKQPAIDAMKQAIDAGLSVNNLHRLERPGHHAALKSTGVSPREF